MQYLGFRNVRVMFFRNCTYVRDVLYVTRKTYLFPQTRRVGFPKVAARQYADARAAICADRQRGILQIVCAAMRGRSTDLYNAEEVLE